MVDRALNLDVLHLNLRFSRDPGVVMQSIKIDAFLSCSFDQDDSEVVEFFRTVAEALDVRSVNVANASTNAPPHAAAEMIDNASLLIAVCTKRDELTNGKHVMPQAVQDEISIAFGKKVPILMFVEDGVELAGFKANYGTYEKFNRANLRSDEFIKKAVIAIHTAKLTALGDDGGVVQSGMDDAVSEYVKHLVELKDQDGDYVWHYYTQKKMTYNEPSKRAFPSGVWPTVKAKCGDTAGPATWSSRLIASSNDIKLIEEIERHTADCIEVLLKPEPHPDKNDFIEYATHSSSRYINAVWFDEVEDGVYVHMDQGDFECADGLLFIHRAKAATIEFRFPESYGISVDDLHPVVGAYSTRLDYVVPSEIERAEVRKESFAGNVTITMKITSPLPGHLYGIAWHPPVRPSPSQGGNILAKVEMDDCAK